MKRRDFAKGLAFGAAAGIIGTVAVNHANPSSNEKSKKPKKVLMHVGSQQAFGSSDKDMQFLARCGVWHKSLNAPYSREKGIPLEEVLKLKDQCEKHGISLDVLDLPFRKMNVEGGSIMNVMLGNFDKGEKECDQFCEMIRTSARASIHCLLYSLKIIENQRTERTIGRGGSRYSSWDLEKAKDRPPRFEKPVTEDMAWERITFFLDRVIPAAEEYKVRMVCHPEDPWFPHGYRNSYRPLGGPEGFKRFIKTNPSSYNGLVFCLGCMSEACDNPAEEVYDIIRYFGKRKRIFHVHFRNIRGGRNKFQEVWPDEGDVNMYKAMKVFKEVEYPYMLVPDHSPGHTDDPGSYQGFAFQFGYIKALIQAVSEEE
ncbi:mannonate dehydratase [candidate division KSB1 bacterium]